MRVLNPSFFPRVSLPLLFLPIGYCLMVNPRKSKPTFPSTLLSVWETLVLLGLSSNPISASQSFIIFWHFRMTSNRSCRMTKSSAYLISDRDFLLSLLPPFRVSAYCLTLSSIPCKAMLANNGLITPPCGVPSLVGNRVLSSMTPDFNQVLICRLNLG
ncbi:hypothetical protein MiSe_95000 [Microseira wollei NIES-4236]|uniref:Uncharacterized protein n=1 Tax=Microseira wollei NIES-4236 TaxID=2530354 RepID=A0AAV3XUR7_9CYAN|nr:hypothetical protein MiSe_95000 [Microseira wollei NIES-4236]